MTQIQHLHDMLDALYCLASDPKSSLQKTAQQGLKGAERHLRVASKTIASSGETLLTPQLLAEMVTIASELDKTGDPILVRQASVLDEILLTIGVDAVTYAKAKGAQDQEIERIKSKQLNSLAADPKYIADGQKAIEKIKEYRPMEANLSTRTCPDHPGAQMARVGDNTFQCSLDKKIYNYQSGYTTLKGNSVPGGDVSNQTQALFDRPNEFTSFETRENKLGSL